MKLHDQVKITMQGEVTRLDPFGGVELDRRVTILNSILASSSTSVEILSAAPVPGDAINADNLLLLDGYKFIVVDNDGDSWTEEDNISTDILSQYGPLTLLYVHDVDASADAKAQLANVRSLARV